MAASIECFWTIRHDEPGALHRVLPDGCADILFRSGSAPALEAVGPMTRFRDHELATGRLLGMRLRPGRGRRALAVPHHRIVDATLPLESLWGKRARQLLERLANASSDEACARLIEASIPAEPDPRPVELAIAHLERTRGNASLEDLARAAGSSPRQFRRLCLEATGLSPKFLARVLRFRSAAGKLGSTRSSVDLALECGYYDQAHLIRDFHEFAGQSPGRARSAASL